jgi:DNA-binding HxlR family transcriptional regulator
MRQTSFADMQCSLARTLEVVGDRWSPLILRDLYLGIESFDDLAQDLGISRNLLADRLTRLVEGGVVERTSYQDRPARYSYRLTESGREPVPVLMALTARGDRWATPDGGPPLELRHQACGRHFTPTVSCSECDRPIAMDDVETLPGPGGQTGPAPCASPISSAAEWPRGGPVSAP